MGYRARVVAAPSGARATVPRAKLQVPRLTDGVVLRTRLLDAMAADENGEVQVTSVVAPAGSGKTILMAQRYAELTRAGRPVAWVSLDGDDNDPFVLWSGILLATARVADHGDVTAALRGLSPPVRATDTTFVTAFVDALNLSTDALWLVLDDVHLIDPGPALDSLAALLRNLPPHLRIMVGARHDPPLPLARLLMEGRAAEIRFTELAFDRGETKELLARHDVRLAEPELGLLMERTEGWVAGLRLAALSLARTDDQAEFVANFAGDARAVADYLVSEVLARMSPDIEDFLLTTAVPEQISVDLARELSGRDDAGILLDGLERANAMIQRLGQNGDWYRYHSLLRSYLVAELARRDGRSLRRLHATTADWLDEQDLPGPALDHAAAARDWDQLARLVDRHGLRLLLAGDTGSLRRALRLLPGDVGAHAVPGLVAVLLALDDGDLATARDHLDRFGRVHHTHDNTRLRVMHATTLLYEARLRGDPTAPVLDLIATASTPVDDDPDLELLATANRGIAYIGLGEYHQAEAELVTALRVARRHGRDYIELDCLTHLSGNAADLNDFLGMRRWAEQAIAFAEARGWASSPKLADAYVVAAWAACQMLDHETAARYVLLADTALIGDREPEVELANGAIAAIVAFDGGVDRRSALTRLREHWRSLDGKRLSPALVAFVCGAEQHMALQVGEFGWATDVVERAGRYLGESGDTHVFRAVMHAHDGREAAVRKTLAPVLTGEARCHGVTSDITAWLLAAHQADANDDALRAHEALTRALDLAAPRHAKRDLSHASTRVVRRLIRNRGRFGAHEAFVDEVLAARSGDTRRSGNGMVWGDTLTSRELSVLRDLPSLLSLEEIAEAHVVSVNTVKTHLKAVYRKLGVNDRRSAVDRARELGLL